MIALTDGREEIQLDLTDDELLRLMKMAHEADLTFNEFVEQALVQFIERHRSEGILEDDTADQLLNKLDGSSEHGLVSPTWPYPN
jgi:hypothetical protein